MKDRVDRGVPGGHIPALDGLRGLAVLAVIAFHLALYAPVSSGGGALVVSLARFGWVGVDLFFVLSGFLITGILYDNRGRAGYFRSFYGRRALRILPLYLTTLAALGIAYAIVGGTAGGAVVEALPWHATFLTNVRVAMAGAWTVTPAGTSHLWSLAVEEQFYLVWPVVVALLGRSAGRDARVALMLACVGLIAAAAVARAILAETTPLAAYVLFPTRMDSLAIGGWLALYVRGPFGSETAHAAAGPVLALASIMTVALALLSGGEHSYLHPLQASAGYTLWAVAFGAVVALGSSPRISRFRSALEWGPLAYLGRISFGLYLVHFPLLHGLVAAGALDAGFAYLAIATVGSSVAVASASRRWLELPALRLKRYFRYGPTTRGSASRSSSAAWHSGVRPHAAGPALRTRRQAPTLIVDPRS